VSAEAAVSARINYHREGDGPPLVLIHGIGHHWQIWRPVIPLLAADFDVVACDSPGFGGSAPLPDGVRPTIGAYAAAYRRFFVELGLGRPHVAGNSMGGAIALELARAGAVCSACALSPAGFWTERERRFCQISLGTIARVPAAIRPTVEALSRTRVGRAVLYAQLFGRPTRLPADEAVSALRDAWAAPAFIPALEAFDEYAFSAGDELRGTPVTVAWGKRDRLLLYARQAPRAQAMLPWARHLTLGAGHIPCFDDPAAVAEVVRSSAIELRGSARASSQARSARSPRGAPGRQDARPARPPIRAASAGR
jgi:pimeloyl-ACP methyl ester carboxylesterase